MVKTSLSGHTEAIAKSQIGTTTNTPRSRARFGKPQDRGAKLKCAKHHQHTGCRYPNRRNPDFMNHETRCCATVYDHSMNFPRPKQCKRNAMVERDGKPYCGTHDPVSKQSRDEARSAQWKKESEARSLRWKKETALWNLGDLVESSATDSEIATEVRRIFAL